MFLSPALSALCQPKNPEGQVGVVVLRTQAGVTLAIDDGATILPILALDPEEARSFANIITTCSHLPEPNPAVNHYRPGDYERLTNKTS